jgi:hypothetical protein
VENSLYIKYYKVNTKALSIESVLFETSFYIMYHIINIKAFLNKECCSGKLILYYVL